MSLLRFLKFGRAFNQGNGMGRYRLPKHGSLPKFNVNREPGFKSTAVRAIGEPAEPRRETVMKQSIAQPAAVFKRDALEFSNGPEQKPVANGARKGAKADTVRLPASTQPVHRVHEADEVKSKRLKDWGWTRKLNPFAGRPAQQETKPVEPVQREFSLDEVKPVRNDLSDSDLELVSVIQPAPEQKPTEKAEKAEKAQPDPNTLWGRLSDKLFDAGRTP